MGKKTVVSETYDLSGRNLQRGDCTSIATTVAGLKQVKAARCDNHTLHVDIDLGGLDAERRDKVLESVHSRIRRIVDHKVTQVKDQKVQRAMAVHATSTID